MDNFGWEISTNVCRPIAAARVLLLSKHIAFLLTAIPDFTRLGVFVIAGPL